MGYSVSVTARSSRLRDEMYAFLLERYRSWSQVLNERSLDDAFQGPLVGGTMKGGVGFEFDPVVSAPEREYHYALVRWMAIQIGKRRSKFRSEGLGFARAVPFFLYGGEALPILLQAEWPETTEVLQAFVFDGLGMRVDNATERELAWYCLPENVFERISATHHGQPSTQIQEALIQEGLPGARETLQIIRSQIALLDVVWREHVSGF